MEELQTPLPKKSISRRILSWLLWIIAGCILLIISLVSLLFIYEDEVKAAILKELNKHLKAEVKIDPKNIDLTIIKTFPDCSIQFKDLLMLEALPIEDRDTLLFTKQLNLHFNISNLWNKHYDIEKIKLSDAVAKVRVLKNGKVNYLFWENEKTESSKKQDSLNFNLNLVSIDHCRVNYINQQQQVKTIFEINTLDFKGNFKQSHFDMSSKAQVFIYQIAKEKTTYIKNKTVNFEVELAVAENKFTFKKTKLSLNNLVLALNGQFAYKDSLQNLSLNLNAPNLNIASALSLLPEKFKKKINDYESSGNFYAQGSVIYSGKNDYNITGSFGVTKGSVTYKPQATIARNINVEGTLKLTPASSLLHLKNISIQLNNDLLKGNCLVKDFSDPYIKLNAVANLHLENLQSFFPIDTLTKLKGQLTITSDLEGSLKDLKTETFSKKVKLNLEATVSDLEAQFKNDDQLFLVEHCAITAFEREVEVKDLRLKRGSSDITLNGKIPGVFNYLWDRKAPLIISGNLISDYIRLEDFLPRKQNQTTNDKALIPENVQFKLNTTIGKFTFAKFIATSVSGEIDIKDQKAVISDINLKTMEGSAEIDAFADNSKKKLDIVLQSKLKNISAQELFSQFNNFGQATLQDKNINGSVSATIDFSGTWSNSLQCNYKSIRATCDLLMERGELINFKPLLSLSKFVDVQDLQRIRFSTLKSNIRIDNSTIIFPKTSIKNSAINIDFWGTHTFDNAIDYHIQLLISDLLAKKRKLKDEPFGPIEKDNENKRSAFILMTGTVDHPIIKYDRKGMKEKIKDDIKQEKQNIRQVLKEEFGLFKKDSSNHKTKASQEFKIENSDNNPPKKTLELKKKKEDDEDF